MVESPEQDRGAWQPRHMPQLHGAACGPHAVGSGSLGNVTEIRAVPAHMAFLAQLLQRYPASVMGEHNAQTGRPAVGCLQLHEQRGAERPPPGP